MMELNDKAIQELQRIYKEEFGMDLSEDEARGIARRLLMFFWQYFKWEEHNR